MNRLDAVVLLVVALIVGGAFWWSRDRREFPK